MALLLKPSIDPANIWLDLFRENAPDLEVRVWPEIGNPDDVEFALVQRPEPGTFDAMPNLRWGCSIPAGVEPVLKPGVVPAHLPILRCVTPQRGHEMADYVLMQTLMHHRQLRYFHRTPWDKAFSKPPQPEIAERRVGVMGVGALGLTVATHMQAYGFPTAGWARRPRPDAAFEVFAGADAMPAFLARTDVLICLLALTKATRGVLNATTFHCLPPGAFVINVARGEHLVEADLIAALDSGHLSGACLDVLRIEPPAADHPLLHHDRVIVTPHISCRSRAPHMLPGILDNMRRARTGEPLLNRVDRAAGY